MIETAQALYAAGEAVNSSTQFTGPSASLTGVSNGQYCYEYVWTGRKTSDTYYAVVHARDGGTSVKTRIKFAVVQ
ncbi:MAG: hypothetical protein AAB268_08295 [Elusimicrobiota bacterium]